MRISRNKKSRSIRDGRGTVVLAVHVGAEVRLMNFVVFIFLKRGYLTWKGCRTKDSTVRLWTFVFGSIDPIWKKRALSLALN